MLSRSSNIRRHLISGMTTLGQGFFPFLQSTKMKPVKLDIPLLFNYDNSLMVIHDCQSFSLKTPMIQWTKKNIETGNITSESLKKNPTEPLGWHYQRLAKYYLTTDELENSLTYAKKSLSEEPKAETYRLCGIVYLELNDAEHALQMFRLAVSICNEKKIDCYWESLSLAIAQLRTGDIITATKTLSQLIVSTPNSDRIVEYNLHSLRGIFYALQHKNDLAKKDIYYAYNKSINSSKITKIDKLIYHYNFTVIDALCQPGSKSCLDYVQALAEELENLTGFNFENDRDPSRINFKL